MIKSTDDRYLIYLSTDMNDTIGQLYYIIE